MLQIVLIRPGATDYDREDRIQGSLDIPLNEEGNAEVARIIEQLTGQGLEVVYAPACEPAHQTGEAIAKALAIKLRKLERMQNINYGLWQGMLIQDVREKQSKVYRQWQEQPEIVCPPEGEMLSEADDRVRTAMTKLFKRHKQGVIAVVVPEPLASLVRRFVQHDELGDLWKAHHEHGRWEVLTVEPDTVVAHSG